MPWAKVGDNAASYPKLLMIAGLPGADGRAVNEAFGFLYRCATESAGHLTDYIVHFGTAQMIGGTRTRKLIGWCVRTGLLAPVEDADIECWAIINDPDFIHIRTAAEVEWDRQRRNDTRDIGLIVPVRLRDGDNCRYCGVFVQWRGAKSGRSAEYDHRVPGQAATIDTLVVACRSCNAARKNNPQWDDDHPLRPAPRQPNYGATTTRFLNLNGYPEIRPNVQPDATTTSSAETAAHQPRPAAQRETRPAGAAGQRPTAADVSPDDVADWYADLDNADEGVPRAHERAEQDREVDSKSISHSDRSGCAGSGRDGPGPGPTTGTGQDPGPGSDPAPTRSPRRRRRRGGRGRGGPARPVGGAQ